MVHFPGKDRDEPVAEDDAGDVERTPRERKRSVADHRDFGASDAHPDDALHRHLLFHPESSGVDHVRRPFPDAGGAVAARAECGDVVCAGQVLLGRTHHVGLRSALGDGLGHGTIAHGEGHGADEGQRNE